MAATSPVPDAAVDTYSIEHRGRRYQQVTIRAGRPKRERVVPPAGERYAFERDTYPVVVDVTVSPTGRSIHVFVNGERVYPRRTRARQHSKENH